MSDRESAEFRPAPESSLWIVIVVVAIVVLGLAAGAVWWRSTHRQAAPVAVSPPAATTPQPETVPPPQAAAPTGPENPIETPQPDAALPKLDEADARVRSALIELLGAKQVLNFLQVDDFVRRAVTTIDNLPRERATARVWPVQPTPSRFAVAGSGTTQTIGAENAARYAPFVQFVESVDATNAAAMYAKFYPLFQQAYEELGYPNRYFNDRLVAVIDHLLQAPEPSGPVQVTLTEVRGEMSSQRPWVRYEFADPELQALSAGQKMMVRMGPTNERRLKAKLAELRKQITTGAVAKKPGS
jgi:hypothetical protein